VGERSDEIGVRGAAGGCAGAAVVETTRERGAPDEATLCRIVFGQATRDDVERELGAPASTRETLDRVVLSYSYGSVGILLHLDRDVFRDFSLYGMRVPMCWAEAKRRSLVVPAQWDAGTY
jgi:hypothetical protein